MKHETEKDELLADVLAGESNLRGATFEAGLTELRRTQMRRRVVRRAAVVVPVLTLLAVIAGRQLHFRMDRRGNAQSVVAAKAEETIPGTTIRVIGDEELLDLFKGRPVALIGPPEHQRLVLLDEAAN